MSTTFESRTIFMRHTDVNGKSVVREHRVWNKDRVLEARRADAERENSKQKPGEPRLAKVEQITDTQYAKER